MKSQHRLVLASLEACLCALIVAGLSFSFTTKASAASSTIMALPTVKSWTGDLDEMLARRIIRILVPVSRTSFFLDRGEAKGFEVELGQEFERAINKKYGSKKKKIQVGFIPVPRGELFTALNKGKGDIAAGTLTVTPERQALVDFAAPWATGVKEVLVTGPAGENIMSIDDVGSRPVTVRKSSSYYSHLLSLNAERQSRGKPLLNIQAADENLEDEDLLEMVGTGLLPWAVVDRFKARIWATILSGLTVHDDIVINEGGDIAWAVRKNSPLLKNELASFVSTHKIGTSFGNDLRLRYFGSGKTIKNALAQADHDKLTALLAFFRNSGAEFEIDPLLLAAQGYQESAFDQTMRSRAGAVGIMQIKPSTAKEKEIGISDVASRADNNIKAGAKYLRYLADTYITDPDVSARNRVLMALAAYNAGPGNLNRFRNYARQHGFNPNIWFGNVETGAGAIVGQETVQYIGNIYKYYIAYSALIPSQEMAREPNSARTPK